MHKHAVKQTIENNHMEVALEALGKSIARWTDKARPDRDRDPGLVTFSAGRTDPADERHVRAEYLLDHTRCKTRAARRRYVCI